MYNTYVKRQTWEESSLINNAGRQQWAIVGTRRSYVSSGGSGGAVLPAPSHTKLCFPHHLNTWLRV